MTAVLPILLALVSAAPALAQDSSFVIKPVITVESILHNDTRSSTENDPKARQELERRLFLVKEPNVTQFRGELSKFLKDNQKFLETEFRSQLPKALQENIGPSTFELMFHYDNARQTTTFTGVNFNLTFSGEVGKRVGPVNVGLGEWFIEQVTDPVTHSIDKRKFAEVIHDEARYATLRYLKALEDQKKEQAPVDSKQGSVDGHSRVERVLPETVVGGSEGHR